MYSSYLITGIIYGFIMTLIMKVIPVFHGYDSNDIRKIQFYDTKLQQSYRLIPFQIGCGST